MSIGGIPINGKYRDIMTKQNGDIIFQSGWRSNLILIGCRQMIAGMMKNQAPQGITHLAVGQGDPAWDGIPSPPPPDPLTESLWSPYTDTIQVSDQNMEYLSKDSQGNHIPSNSITNILRVSVTLPPGFPLPIAPLRSYPLREFGLFGRFGNTDFMINCVRHQRIDKDLESTLMREIILTF